MRIDGHIDDILFVEVPSEQEIASRTKVDKKDLKNGGKYTICMENELFYNNGNNHGLQIVFVLIDREEDKAHVKRFLDGKGVVS